MIPYEDLVYALAEWRARKGLPTATTSAPAARPVSARPTPPAPVASHAVPVSQPAAHAPAPAPAASAAAYDPGYGMPTPAHATVAYGQAGYPGAAPFGGPAPVPPAPASAPNLAVQAAFAGGAHYEHQITDEDEVITLGEVTSPADPLSFEGARAGTQPGVAPGFGNKPGARR